MSWLSATVNMLSQRVSRDFEVAFQHALTSRLDRIEELWIENKKNSCNLQGIFVYIEGKKKMENIFQKNVSKLSTISLYTSSLRVFL